VREKRISELLLHPLKGAEHVKEMRSPGKEEAIARPVMKTQTGGGGVWEVRWR